MSAQIGNAAFFAWIEQNIGRLMARDPAALVHAISRSCEIKARIVSSTKSVCIQHCENDI